MGKRSTVLRLPRPVRKRLDELLIEKGFQDYDELADWLAAEGHRVSRSAVHRYGQGLQERLTPEIDRIRVSNEEARVLMDTLGEDDNPSAKSEAALALARDRIWTAMRRMEPDASLDEIRKGAQTITDVARAGVLVSREKRALLSEAAKRAAREGRNRGLTPEGIAAIRAAVQGTPHPVGGENVGH